jgi:hypothetical protein
MMERHRTTRRGLGNARRLGDTRCLRLGPVLPSCPPAPVDAGGASVHSLR